MTPNQVRARIPALISEAREAGDDLMVIIATHALGEYDSAPLAGADYSVLGDAEMRRVDGMTVESALAECVRVIAARDEREQDQAWEDEEAEANREALCEPRFGGR